MSSDPRHPEAWRVARDLDERAWEDRITEQDIRSGRAPWPDPWSDPEACDAMDAARQVAAQRGPV